MKMMKALLIDGLFEMVCDKIGQRIIYSSKPYDDGKITALKFLDISIMDTPQMYDTVRKRLSKFYM